MVGRKQILVLLLICLSSAAEWITVFDEAQGCCNGPSFDNSDIRTLNFVSGGEALVDPPAWIDGGGYEVRIEWSATVNNTAAAAEVIGCPAGYNETDGGGDIPGWGDVNGKGGGATVTSCGECAAWCSSESTCQSFECSPSQLKCNLNTQPVPTTQGYQDFRFCSKDPNQAGGCACSEPDCDRPECATSNSASPLQPGFIQFTVPKGSNIFNQAFDDETRDTQDNFPIEQVASSGDFLGGAAGGAAGGAVSTASFCHACGKNGYRWADTCWGVTIAGDTNRECG
jgi:hypothetical protein